MIIIRDTGSPNLHNFKKLAALTENSQLLLTIRDNDFEFDSSNNIVDLLDSSIAELVGDEDDVAIAGIDACLFMKGKDYKKWSKDWWKNRIYESSGSTTTKAATKTRLTKHKITGGVARIAYDDGDDVYSDILECSGNESEIVKFLNTQYAKYCIKSFFKKTVVISFDEGPWLKVVDTPFKLEIGEI